MGDVEEAEDAQFPDNDEAAPYVTGGALASGAGAGRVTLWGLVTRVTSDGFYVRGVDEAEVQVRTRSALATPPAGWVEVVGVAQAGGRSLLADDVLVFPEEMTKSVDVEGHRGLARLLAALDDPWNLGDEKTNGHDGIALME